MKFIVDGRQYDTDKMTDLGISTRENHGVSIEGVYMTPKSKRVFVHTHSIWASGRNDGTVVGNQWHEADTFEIARLADEHDCEALLEMVPEGDY